MEVQGVLVERAGLRSCDQRVHCGCWAPSQAGQVHQRVVGNLLGQGSEDRLLQDRVVQEVRSHRTSVLRRDLLTTGQMDSGELVSPVIPRRVRRDYGLLSDPGGVQAVSQGNPPPGGHRTCSAGRSRAWEGLHHQQHWLQGARQASSRSWLSAGGCRSPKLSGRA